MKCSISCPARHDNFAGSRYTCKCLAADKTLYQGDGALYQDQCVALSSPVARTCLWNMLSHAIDVCTQMKAEVEAARAAATSVKEAV